MIAIEPSLAPVLNASSGIVTLTFVGQPEVGADPAVHIMRHFARTLPGARH